MMPCLEVQKDQNSAQKTLLSNLGKDAKNNLGCRLMVGPVLLAHIYHTTLLHKPVHPTSLLLIALYARIT